MFEHRLVLNKRGHQDSKVVEVEDFNEAVWLQHRWQQGEYDDLAKYCCFPIETKCDKHGWADANYGFCEECEDEYYESKEI